MVSYKNPPPHRGSKSTHTPALAQLEPKKNQNKKIQKEATKQTKTNREAEKKKKKNSREKKKDCEKKKGVRERSLARGEEGEERRGGRGEGEWDRALE
jgi:hypothetical protein